MSDSIASTASSQPKVFLNSFTHIFARHEIVIIACDLQIDSPSCNMSPPFLLHILHGPGLMCRQRQSQSIRHSTTTKKLLRCSYSAASKCLVLQSPRAGSGWAGRESKVCKCHVEDNRARNCPGRLRVVTTFGLFTGIYAIGLLQHNRTI